MRSSDERVWRGAFVDDVTDEVLLSVVGGKYGDALGGPAQQPHVHEYRHHVLRFR